MIVELHDRLRNPLTVPATRVLLSADDGTPVCLVVEFQSLPKPWFRVFRAGDPDFNEQLRMAGVRRTVIAGGLSPGVVPGR